MADAEFERRLERLFIETPEFADAAAFASGVERRLDRGWNLRTVLIGAAGVLGGVIGASQLLVSNLIGRIETASSDSVRLVNAGVTQIKPQAELLASLPSGSVVWMASGMAVLAMAFVLSRVIEEF